jgi:predicted RNA-binding Zn-ribbon protein involved in translation (DUF1610 family)
VSRGPRYSEQEARKAISASRSWAEALRRLGMCQSGGGGRVLRKYAIAWGISTEHFDPYASARRPRSRLPLDEALVERSTYSRKDVKRRLYQEGLKQPVCELCGQDEIWRGARMSLILDHINGVSDDNRLENLRIVCPNCAATFDTHCARGRRLDRSPRPCERCGEPFTPKYPRQRYCSLECGSRWDRSGRPRPSTRRVDRPPYPQLLREVRAVGYCATGRRYGVSDNAIRKWIRQYEREAAARDKEAA